MKDYLKKLLENKKDQRKKLNDSLIECESKEERSSILATIATLDEEIREGEVQLAALEAREAEEANAANNEQRNNFNPNAALNVVATAQQNNANGTEGRSNENPRSTMEYRTSFMKYIQRGEMSDVLQFEQRTAGPGVAGDLGVLLPETIVQEVIKGVEKVYGQLYSRVKKTNIKGGVKYPIGSFKATFHRIKETGQGSAPSERQKSGSVSGYVEFSYNIGEIRISRTLLQDVLTVPAFEREVSKVLIEAYVEAMDKEIMTGVAANNQCEGILTEAAKGETSRIPANNIIEFTADDMKDWKQWQKKLFAVIPLSMRGAKPEFAMTANTYEANIKTLKDDNNRPVYNETFNPVDGTEISRFKGKDVVFVEEDILKNFDDAVNGEYFGMYWVPELAYAINSNMEFTMIRYFDQEKNEYVDKALVINDGKVLDPKYIYLLKKKVVA